MLTDVRAPKSDLHHSSLRVFSLCLIAIILSTADQSLFSYAIPGIQSALRAIDSALVTVRQSAQSFGSNSALLQIRADFTTTIVNTLKGGASQLVNADLNEESANMLSLQTRQQLGTISLSIAQKSEQAILRLF